MDTTDPQIVFDSEGVCSHCRDFDQVAQVALFQNEEGGRKLKALLDQVKAAGRGQQYNCLIGLSGGADSSYVAMKAADWGLRPLVVHVDTGWNSELAVDNIERIVKSCNFHLHTTVIDWSEMRDLQLAYLRAGVANQDVPQDHAIFASTYHFAVKHGVRYILTGGNIATEGIFPDTWLGDCMDALNLKAIHAEYGRQPLRTYKTIGWFAYYLWYPLVRQMQTIRPLNYLLYDKAAAVAELSDRMGWRPYGRKHGESLFTKLFQNYYLPTRFGFDKRRPHLSSMVASGQITRDDAIASLAEPLYDARELERDISYFCKKLGISREEFEQFMHVPRRGYADFDNWTQIRGRLKRIQSIAEKTLGRRWRVYS